MRLTARALTAPAIWVGILTLGALLLYGRFDWSGAHRPFARQAYFSCLYFFVFVIPSVYGLARAAGARVHVARGVAAIVFVVASLPAHWLRLDRFRHVPWGYRDWAHAALSWLPGDVAAGAPAERPLLLALLLAFVAARAALAPSPRPWRRIGVEAALFAFILLQAALHTSMRSPYTYVPHFENGGWYHDYILPDAHGAVNADRYQFLWLDDHFNAIGGPVHGQLLRRPFAHYIGSWFSFFFNDYYVYLALNAVLWLGAALCMRDYARRVSGSTEVARWTMVLTACGSGFIFYVAQPMSYLASYAAVIVTWWTFELTLVAAPRTPVRSALLFGVVLGLCSTTYDLFPIYPALLLYAWLRRASLAASVAALVLGAVIYGGYLLVQRDLLGLSLYSDNAIFAEIAARKSIDLLRHPIAGDLFDKTLRVVVTYGQDLLYAFYGLTTLLAVAGLLAADRRTRALILVLLVPTLLGTAVLYFGGVTWGRVLMAQLPRLTFGAFPAVYLAAAVALTRMRETLGRTRLARGAGVAPWLVIATVVVIANVDVFGYPEAAYHFYWPTPMACPPYELRTVCPPY